MVNVMHESTTDKCRSDVAYRPDDGPPELATRKPWTAIGCIIHARSHATRVRQYLAECDEYGKCDCELQAQHAIKSGPETQPADGGEHSLPEQGVVVQAARGSIEFNGQRDAGGYA